MIRHFIFLCLIIFQPHLISGQEDQRLLPAPGDLAGWQPAGKARLFTSADLYGHIDGGAEVFLELGFEQLTLQYYQKDEAEISVELYRMKDVLAAFGIYRMKCGRETPDSTLEISHTVNRYQIMFHRGRYFGIIYNHNGDKENGTVLVSMTTAIIDRLPPETPIPMIGRLPQEGLKSASIRVIRGPYTLQSVYSLGEGDVLSLGDSLTALSADYQPSGQKSYMLVSIIYPSIRTARVAWEHLKSKLDRYIKILKWGQHSFYLQDYEQRHLFGEQKERTISIRINHPSG